MKSQDFIPRARRPLRSSSAAAILVASCRLLSSTQAQTGAPAAGKARSTTLSVHIPEPLADVLDMLQQSYLVPITFEEAPFESDQDLTSTPIKQTDGSTIVFRSLPAVDFSVSLEGQTSAGAAAQTVLAAYRNDGFPGVYDIVQNADRIDVVPKQIRASTGLMRNVTPVMSYPVSFPLATRGSIETLQLLATTISRESGAHVEVLNTPFHWGDTLTMSAGGEPARDVIARLGAIFHFQFSFQCLWDATRKTYYLNVRGVFAPNPPGQPAQHGYIRRNTGPGPANSPWFTKDP